MRNNFKSAVSGLYLGLAAIVLATAPAQAVPVFHNFFLNNSGGTSDFTGTFSIDSSRLTPNTFTSFFSGFITGLTVTIGTTTFTQSMNTNPIQEGVLTDATGAVFTIFDNGGGTTINFGSLSSPPGLVIQTNNGLWQAKDAVGTFFSGPTHTIGAVATVPEPLTLLLFPPALLALGTMRRKRRKKGSSVNYT